MLQAPKTVHMPLSPLDAHLLLPLLDRLTQYLTRWGVIIIAPLGGPGGHALFSDQHEYYSF